MKPIDAFVLAVRRQLNGYRATTTFLWSSGIGAAVLLGIAAFYLIQGEAVPKLWYAIATGAILMAAAVGILLRRLSVTDASEFADHFFKLHDSLTSVRRFDQEGLEGGFYDLSRQKTEQIVAAISPEAVPCNLPRRLLGTTLVLVLTAGSTAFIPPSQEVLDRIVQEDATEEATADLKEELMNFINELERTTEDPLERELLNAEQLRKWVEELDTTRDLKQALRQYAGLERQLAQAASRLSQRRDEQLLAKAGEEVKQDASNRQLGEKLVTREYQQAAEEVRNLLPKPQPDADVQLKELTRLRAASKRMASAARSSKSTRKSDEEGQPDELEDLLEQLEQQIDDLHEDLENADQGDEPNDDQGEQMEPQKNGAADQVEKLGRMLDRLEAKKRIQGKLGDLQKKMADKGEGVGGKKAGVGSVDSRRDERDELDDNGQYARLRGIKGKGPSETTVEATDDGTGVSHRVAEERERTFAKQFESFVQREDVPDDVKDGVREYFTNIHEPVDEN